MTAREQAVRFGEEQNLVGVLVQPEAGVDPGRPAVLFYNVGFGHRVGPHRVNVELSRALAEHGFASLRFDLSGQGDSDPSSSTEAPVPRAVSDLGQAMAFVTRRCGATRFAIVCMCSGTDPGHAIAVQDPRVVAAAFLDGYAYPTRGYRARNLALRLARPWTWPARLRQALRRGPSAAAAGRATAAKGDFFERTYPTHEVFRRDVMAILSRGTRLLYVYSYGWWYYNHTGQLAEILGVRRLPPRVHVEYWTDSDHMFTGVPVRARLGRCVVEWLSAAFPAAAAPAPQRTAAS